MKSILQSNVLVCFIVTNFIAVTPTAKAAPSSPDSLSLNTDLFQMPVGDSSQELIFSSNGNPEAALYTDPLQVSSLDPQADAVDTSVFDDDDFLTLEATSDDLFASACRNKILRRGNDPSSCEPTDNQAPNPDVDLLQRLGQGDLLLKLLATPPGSQDGSELLENDDRRQTLPEPYDIGCRPGFPFRLCCNGPPMEAGSMFSAVFPAFTELFDGLYSCYRCMYFLLFLFEGASAFSNLCCVFFPSQRFWNRIDSFNKPNYLANNHLKTS